MKRASRRRLRPTSISGPTLTPLKGALLGTEPGLSPEWAAEALAKSREGKKLLVQLIRSGETSNVRRAAVYGFVWGEIDSFQFNLLLRVFENAHEEPSIRGQAAEALGPRVRFNSKRSPPRRRDWRARLAFVRGLDDSIPEVRFWSIFALANPDNEWMIPRLETMTADHALIPGMWTVGQEASWAIRWIRAEEDVDPRLL